MTQHDIAIVGMSCVFPGAVNVRQFWSNIVNGVDAIGPVPAGRWHYGRNYELPPEHDAYVACSRGGFLPDEFRMDPVQFGVFPNLVREGDADQFLILHVVDEALKDAGVAADAAVRQRTDLIVGRGGYPSNRMIELAVNTEVVGWVQNVLAARMPDLGPDKLAEIESVLRRDLPKDTADNISTLIPNLTASRAANRLDLRGAAYTVDAACASSLVAVEHLVHRLRLGLCDLGVAGGISLNQNPGFWAIFTRLGAISPNGVPRPFDRRADGIVLSEGAGAVVLKRLDDARRDGDQVYAVIKGVGSSSDGRDTGVLAPALGGQLACLRQAYRDAQIDPTTIGYLEAHGTGTMAGDLTEIATIKTIYHELRGGACARPMGSVKSMIGHAVPAAGIASLIKTALALSNKLVPPSLHCDEPHPDLADAPFYVNPATRPWIHSPKHHPRRAGVNAFGFGGINCHVILEEVPEAAAATVVDIKPRPIVTGLRRPTDLFVFSGASRSEVSNRLQRLERYLETDRTGHRLEDVAYTLTEEFQVDATCKLAIIAGSLTQLRELMSRCREQLQTRDSQVGDQETCYYSDSAAEQQGQLALTFPGMGFPPGLVGEYPDRLLQMCCHFPDMRQEFDTTELRDEHPEDPVPTSSILCPPPNVGPQEKRRLRDRLITPKLVEEGEETHVPKPTERNLAPMGVTLSNWASWVLLRPLGIPVDMLCGQSQGDLAALCVAGATQYPDLADRFWESQTMPPTYTAQGHLGLVAISAERLRPYLDGIPEIDIAIHAGQAHLVLGGTSAAFKELIEKLKPEGISIQYFPYPPIHTPRLTYMKDEVSWIAERIQLAPAKIPIYCSTSADVFPSDPAEMRATLMNNFDKPVLWWQTYRKMYDDGARIFLQAGGTIANNVERIVHASDLVSVSVDVNFRDPISQLNHVCATLLTYGCRFQLTQLHRYRDVRRLSLDAPQPSPLKPTMLRLRLDPESMEVKDETPQAALVEHVSTAEDSGEEVASRAEEPASDERPALLPGPADRFLPLVGDIVHHVPGEEIVTERRLSLVEDRYLSDHLFINALDVKPASECLPVMPMTMAIEMISEIAACLAPELEFLGLEQVRASRWLALDNIDSLLVQCRAKLASIDEETGVHRIQVELVPEGHETPSTSATVLFGPEIRQDVDVAFTEIGYDLPWRFDIADVYRDGHMFHGPAFQCITDLRELGEPGCVVELTVPAPDLLFASTSTPELLTQPCVMDNIGQVLGCWILSLFEDTFVLPISVGKIEQYCPAPPPGTKVQVRIEITKLDLEAKEVRMDVEVDDGNGYVWMRLTEWTDRIFSMPTRVIDVRRLPHRYSIADVVPLSDDHADQVCMLVERSYLRDIPIDWLARLYLSSAETRAFDELAGQRQRQREWLMGRIAAKDAVRMWLMRRQGANEMVQPCMVVLENDPQGRPQIVSLPGDVSWPHLSISHSGRHAVALVGEMPTGIDIEPAAKDPTEILECYASERERQLLAAQSDKTWPTRLWCAKEAVGKALGTGLAGRPMDFEAIELLDGEQIHLRHHPTSEEFLVDTRCDDELVMATTVRGSLCQQE